MVPAIFSRTYPFARIGDVLQAIGADGFAAAQMNLSSFGMASLPERLDVEALDEGRTEALGLGLRLAALSGTYNMAHPEPAVRQAKRAGFRQVLAAAARIGAPVVTLCTGSRNTTDMWAAHPDNGSPAAWADMRAELDWALDAAQALDLTLAIEPEPGNVVADARAARRLLDETAAPNLRIILDAANLIGRDGLARQASIVSEAVDLLGPDVVLAHAKDIGADGTVTAPGDGVIDLAAFAAALAGAGFAGPLVAHGFDARHTARAGAAMAALCATG